MSKTSRPSLLTIAGELRNRIYELVLLPEDQVYPFDYKPCSCNCPKHLRHAPSVSLLAVNKQINSEATAILYGGVTFNLATGFLLMKFMAQERVCFYGVPDLSKIYPSRQFIRSLHLNILPEFTPHEVHASRMLECWSDSNFQQLSKKQRAQSIHQHEREVCQTAWTNAGKMIMQIKALKSLLLDVEQAFCPGGCCRMVGHVLRSFRSVRKKEDFKIEVLGELKPEEKGMLLKGLRYLGREVGTSKNDMILKTESNTDMSEDESGVDEDESGADEDGSEEEEMNDEESFGEVLEGMDMANDFIQMAAVRALRAVIHGTTDLNGQTSGNTVATSAINLSVSAVDYPPQ